MTIGKKIQDLLLEQGRTCGWLALQTGLDRTGLYKLVKGKVKYPRTTSLVKIAKALKVSPFELLLEVEV